MLASGAEIPAITVATALVVGIPSLLIALATYWLATRASRTAQDTVHLQVDAEAYRRARELYESAIENLRQQVGDLRTDLESTRRELRELQSGKHKD